MIADELKNTINQFLPGFWQSGFATPLTVTEQMVLPTFSGMQDIDQTCDEPRRSRTDKAIDLRLDGDRQHPAPEPMYA